MSYGPNENDVPLWVRLRSIPGRLLHRLIEAGAALVWPIERAVAAALSGLIRASDGSDRFANASFRVRQALLWPWHLAGRIAVSAGDRLVRPAVRERMLRLLHAITIIAHRLADLFTRGAEALNLDGVVHRTLQISRPIWYPFAALSGFAITWFVTRRRWQLLWGLPLLLLLLPLLAAGVWMAVWGHDALASSYSVAVHQALEARDYRTAGLFERKLAQLGVNTKLTDYRSALQFAQDGKYAQAYERMQILAPLDRPGYPPAHYWILEQLLSRKLDVPADEARRAMDIHLKHLQWLGFKGPEMQLVEGALLVQNEQFEEALKLLRPLAGRFPAAAMLRLEINHKLGRLEEARGDSRYVRAHNQERIGRSGPLTAEEYRLWAIAELFLGDVATADTLVRKWRALDPESQEARLMLADLCKRQFEALLAVPRPAPQRLAELLAEAAVLTDDPLPLQHQVGVLYRQRARIAAAKPILEHLSKSPETPASLLEAMGSAAAEAGEFDWAKAMLLRAVEKDPVNAVAWNNYAWLLAQGPQADLNAALAAVNRALEIAPDEHRYRETRGQILIRLKRWKDALPDLEFAVNAMPDARETHSAMAKAYDALGQNELAQLHRQQAE